ncbi:MAG TPA: TerC/Alx family metal homeostasis membrane protein [Gaiellaceae bacterium]|nr:TerC/Alx family metal homeostasis membrane protein [Gaiellaceae bacterium]
MSAGLAAWLALSVAVAALFALDLVLFRRTGEIPFARAAAWSALYTVLGLAFGALLWAWQGPGPAEEYLAGFLIEKSLSVDNVFVFALIFAYFAVPAASQGRVLFWGIAGALLLRAVFIAAGAALLDAVHATVYVFGALLLATAVRIARHTEVEVHPERNPALRLLRRLLPVTGYRDDRFLVREGGRLAATPLAAALVLVASFDVVFAVDSIPAIFAVTRDPFIVFAANAFSLLGLAPLYFLLAGMMHRFHYLNLGLGVILAFVGAKMLLSDLVKIPVYVSLAVIVAVLGLAVGASLLRPRTPAERAGRAEAPAPARSGGGDP